MDDELADLEKEFNKNEQAKKSNPLGNSITKEMLQQSKKEIDQDGFDIEEDFFEEKKPEVKAAAPVKKNLEIAIDDNVDYEVENNQANENLNNKLMVNQSSPSPPGMNNEEEEEIEMTQEEIIAEFDEMYRKDPELRAVLGEFPDQNYSLDEKLSIVVAYKKGGGVAGLADIIDDEDDDEQNQTGPSP